MVVDKSRHLLPIHKDSDMSDDTLITAVEQMRHWQKEYFRTRSTQALDEAKKFEKQVDNLLIERRDTQKKLF